MKTSFFKNLATNSFLMNFMATFAGVALILTVA
jgi:hypothetical protein